MTHYSSLNDKPPVCSGPEDCDPGCACVDGECVCCSPITEWRIKEASNKVDELYGVVSIGPNPSYQHMNNLPQPWTVPHYNGALPLSLSMQLEVKCIGEWKKIDEWTADVGTCGHTANRWPTKVVAEYGCYAAPAPCDCYKANGGDCTDPPYPCPLVCIGTQYDPPNGAAYTFTGAVDGEWTNLKNWKDFAGASPANQLPDANSVIVIDGNLQTIPTGTNASVDTVTVTAAGAVRIPLSTTHAEVRGIIGIGSSEACGKGVLTMAGTEAAEFKGAGSIEAGAEVIGNANFSDTSHNDGTVTLDASFTNTSLNSGTGVVKGFGTFSGGSSNNGTVEGDGAFSVTSTNQSVGTIEGDATFSDDSRNLGTVEGDATFSGITALNGAFVLGNATFTGITVLNTGNVSGDATFSNGASSQGIVQGNATFNGGAGNVSPGGRVYLDATFNSSVNNSNVSGNATFTAGSGNGGTIQGNAVFTDSSNGGSVVGTATFNVTGGVTAGGTVGGLATFNGATINAGVLTVNALFNGNSHNEGTVGDATFDNSAYNNAIVTGVATFNLTSHNDAAGGVVTAIFNNSSINNGAATTATFNNTSSNAAGLSMTIGTATFNNTSENNGYVSGNATFNDTSSNRGRVAGNAAFNTSSYNACVLGAVAGTATYNGLTGPVSLKYYILGQCTTLDSTGSGYWNSTYYYNGNVVVPTSQIFKGSINGDWNNLGNWQPFSYLPLLAERLPLSTEDVQLERSVTTNGGSQPTVTNILFGTWLADQTFNINLTVLGTATFALNSINTGTITGNAIFNVDSSNNGTVSGNVTFNDTSLNEGTVSGNATFNTSSYNVCILGSVTGTATYNGLSGPVSPDYYILGECTNLNISGNGFWNGHAYYLGALHPNGDNTYHYYLNDVETTLNSEGNGYWNSQYYYHGIVFEPTSQIFTGSINGDWNNLGNWKPDANLPLLAERLPLSTENVDLWASVTTNGGSQPTVTNLLTGTFAPGQTFNINLTVLGTATFANDSINNGTITGNAIFNSTSSNPGTVSGNATFNENSSNGGTVFGNATWSGSAFTNFSLATTVGGTKTFSSASPVVFTTNGSNNWIYNSSSWIFTAPGPTWIFEGSSSNTGILAGDATFNNSSNNNYIVSGNATFNGSSNQLGTVTGTTTCNTEGTCP